MRTTILAARDIRCGVDLARVAFKTMNVTDSATDAELIATCRDGHRQAWEILIRRYSRLIYSVPCRYGLSEDDAGDVFQNVCLTLYRKLDTLRDPSRLASWLVTTASRECIDLVNGRKKSLDQTAEQDAETLLDQARTLDLPSEEALRRLEEQHLIRQAIGRLPERCQKLLWHLYFDRSQPAYAEIATRMNLSPTAVGINRARCLERLRQALKEIGF